MVSMEPTLVSTSVGCNVLHTPLMLQHALPSTAFCFFFFYLWKFFPKKIKFIESRDLVIACHISKVKFFFLVRQDRIPAKTVLQLLGVAGCKDRQTYLEFTGQSV